jgi:hypothetical protein
VVEGGGREMVGAVGMNKREYEQREEGECKL